MMKTKRNSFERKVPKVTYDPSLDKYNGIDFVPEKPAKANEMLRTVGLPKDKKKKHLA